MSSEKLNLIEAGEIKSETFVVGESQRSCSESLCEVRLPVNESCLSVSPRDSLQLSSKKRKIDEICTDERVETPREFYRFFVGDFDTKTNTEKYRKFYNANDLEVFLRKNEEIKNKTNHRAHLSGDFVTKRFMYYRIDNVRNEMDNKYKSSKYDTEVWLKRTKDDLMKTREEMLLKEKRVEELEKVVATLKYNNEVLKTTAARFEQQNVELSNQMYNFLINQTVINQMLLNKQEANKIGHGSRVMQ